MAEDLHEIVQFPGSLPVNLFLHRLGDSSRHWHRSLEILMVLSGEVDLAVDLDRFRMRAGDVVLVNSNLPHELHSPDAVLIALQIDPILFRTTEALPDDITFRCNSVLEGDDERYSQLRQAIAALVRNNTYRDSGTDYRNIGLWYYLASKLMTYFKTDVQEALRQKRRHAARMTAIVDYIDQHYRENFGLADLAEAMGLSVPYLSSFFSKYMGVNFIQYYTDIKLTHAVRELLISDDSIETVAMNHGFPEPHAFVRAFKRKYGELPSVYRRTHRGELQTADTAAHQVNYLTLEPGDYLHLLKKYLYRGDMALDSGSLALAAPAAPRHTLPMHLPAVAANVSGSRMTGSLTRFLGVGRASELLRSDIQAMLTKAQNEIHFEYIKFHGILSDDMRVCTRDEQGRLHFNYRYVDQAIAFLQSIGLKPLIQLSFMPRALAEDPDKQVFTQTFITSPPKKNEEWVLLVKDFTRHLLHRFGQEKVREWLFCVWCEPETSTAMFGWDDDRRFFDFYRDTFFAVREVCPQLRFGTPSLLFLRHNAEPDWIRRFFRYTAENNCRPDWVNIHYYADIFPSGSRDHNVSLSGPVRLPDDPDDFAQYLTELHSLLAALGADELPVYLTEWNLTFSHRNLINDTCFKSCYIVKNMLENENRVQSFGYWSLTDLIDENPVPAHTFHGGLGMFTMGGLPKSVFYSYVFAALLGSEKLAAGPGYFVTRRGSRLRVMLYHYVHYGSLFANGDVYTVTQSERYGIFDMSHPLEVHLPITGLTPGRYLVRETWVNRENGSIFDKWAAAGGIPMDDGELALVAGSCGPGFHLRHEPAEDGVLNYTATLEPLEIRFVDISLIT